METEKQSHIKELCKGLAEYISHKSEYTDQFKQESHKGMVRILNVPDVEKIERDGKEQDSPVL